jgi:hypothetical protein
MYFKRNCGQRISDIPVRDRAQFNCERALRVCSSDSSLHSSESWSNPSGLVRLERALPRTGMSAILGTAHLKSQRVPRDAKMDLAASSFPRRREYNGRAKFMSLAHWISAFAEMTVRMQTNTRETAKTSFGWSATKKPIIPHRRIEMLVFRRSPYSCQFVFIRG